jgi:hypothetical protein
LTDVLRTSGVLTRSAVVESFEGVAVGTGQMADSVRFVLSYKGDDSGAPRSVVAKFASTDPTSRATGLALRSYEIEVRFYQQVAHTVGIQTARCHFADVDVATGWFTVVLEDLAPAVQGDQLAGCSVDAAALAMDQLARLHAPRWGDRSLADVDWLARNTDEGAQMLAAMMVPLTAGFVERYADRLSANVSRLVERLGVSVGPWMAGRQEPFAVQHGDYRVDNMLFGDTGTVTTVDWQTVIYGPPLSDAAYFLGASLLADDRRQHEDQLLRAYYDHLVASGVSGFSWDRCREDYRRYTFSGLLMAVAAAMLVERTPRGDDMFMTMASRHGQHILDLEAEEFLGTRD